MPKRTSAWVLLVALLLGLCRPLCACHAGQAPSGCHAAEAEPAPAADDCCAEGERASGDAPARSGDGCCCDHGSEPRQKSPEGTALVGDLELRATWLQVAVLDGARAWMRRVAPVRRVDLPTPPLLALHCRLLI